MGRHSGSFLTLAPIATGGGGRGPLRQTDTVRGRRFTECRDRLLKDIAKKNWNSLKSLTRVGGAPILAAPVPAGNDCRLSQ